MGGAVLVSGAHPTDPTAPATCRPPERSAGGVTRGRDGRINAFLNVCRHRGAQLCAEEEGEVRRSFQCPYTPGPTYALDGKLISAPNLSAMPDVDKVAMDSLAYRNGVG